MFHSKKSGVLAISLGLTAALLVGCAAAPKAAPTTEAITTTAPAATELTQPTTGEPEVARVEYHHRGLHFTLPEDFSALERDTNRFTFENGEISGVIDCYALDYFTGVTAARTSQKYAQYLLDSLKECYSEAYVATGDGSFYYVVLKDGNVTTVRGLYVYKDVGWSVLLSSDADKDLTRQMVDIACGGWVQKDQLPYWNETEELTLEYQGMTITLPGALLEEQHYEYLTRFAAMGCSGEISTGSVLGLGENITCPADILWQGIDDKEIPFADILVHGDVAWQECIASAGSQPSMRICCMNRHRYWIMTLTGSDMETLRTVKNSITMDNLSYFRTLKYNLNDYEYLDDLLQELQEAGQADWGRYKLELSGLSQPVTLEMYGKRIEVIRVFNHAIRVDKENRYGFYYDGPNGSFYPRISEYDDAIIINNWDGWQGHTWIFTEENVIEYHPADGCSTMVYVDQEGKLRYSRIALRYNGDGFNQIPYLPLYTAISREEFCQEEGLAELWGGKMYLKPEKISTVDDIYHLEELFSEAKEEGLFPEYDTLDALLYSNLTKYPL